MAKAASPVRLQEELMQAAAITGKRYHRSTAEQIEFWADMGRKISLIMSPDDLLNVSTGRVKIKLETIHAEAVNPDEIFRVLENSRSSGALSRKVTDCSIKYQASLKYPGYLEKIDKNGKIKTGKFHNGEFLEISDLEP